MKLKDVTDSSFERDVVRSRGTVVVDFWAPWCGPCLALTPHLERAAEPLAPETRVVKMDVDSQPQTPARLRVRGLPVLVAFRDGSEIGRLRGVKNPREVEHWLRSLSAEQQLEEIGPPVRLE